MERRVTGRKESLADGMRITASVRARLFGVKLLRIDADVNVVPAVSHRTPANGYVAELMDPVDDGRADDPQPSHANGSIGGGLDEVARSLEAGAVELRQARRGMP